DPGQADDSARQIDKLLKDSQKIAREILEQSPSWKQQLLDDNIWIPATAAEAHLLLQEWETAAQLYRQAISQPNRQAFHPETMKAQVLRFLAAYGRLEIVPLGPLATPDEFF